MKTRIMPTFPMILMTAILLTVSINTLSHAVEQAVAPAVTNTVAVAVPEASNQETMIYAIITLLVPVVASLLANLVEKKPTDSPFKRFLKNTINALALNFSAKAGK